MATDAFNGSKDDVCETPRPGGEGCLGARVVSRIGYGAGRLPNLAADRTAALGLLRRAARMGVDHIDTAQFYGDGLSNSLIGQAFDPDDGIVVVSKIGAEHVPGSGVPLQAAQRPEQLRAAVQDNLRSLRLEQIPVVNLRRLDMRPGLRAEGDQAVDVDDQLAVMVAMRDEGLIGDFGLSAVSADVLRRALPAGPVCVQNAYSLVARDSEELLRICTAHGIAWVPFFPLGGAFPGVPKVVEDPVVQQVAGSLGCTPAQAGLAWLLAHAPTALLIPGTTDPAHLDANLAVGDIRLDDAALAALDAVTSRSSDVPLG